MKIIRVRFDADKESAPPRVKPLSYHGNSWGFQHQISKGKIRRSNEKPSARGFGNNPNRAPRNKSR